MMRRRSWADLSPRAKGLTLAGAAVQLALLVTALLDIIRRPTSEIRGSKAGWIAVSFINFVGPISYLAFGRRRARPRRLIERM